MHHNPHFRVLALTATPGGKPEVVQDIVDAMHISHIEIRNESDADLKKYLHTKVEQEHHVKMTGDVIEIRDALAAVMRVCDYYAQVCGTLAERRNFQPIIKKVQDAGFLKGGNVTPTTLHAFRAQTTVREMMAAKAAQWAVSAAAQLGPLARAMAYLVRILLSSSPYQLTYRPSEAREQH